jgi:purine-binding chemotaxis protein CheW
MARDGGFLVCVFDVAGHAFALRLGSIGEIVPMAALSRPPSMPAILEGFLNLRGTAVPVLRLAALLGLPQDPLDLHTPLIIVRRDRLPLALLVNRVAGIAALPSDALLPISKEDSFNGCVEARLTMEGQAAHLLSLDRLLIEKEQHALAHFQETENRRVRQLERGPS